MVVNSKYVTCADASYCLLSPEMLIFCCNFLSYQFSSNPGNHIPKEETLLLLIDIQNYTHFERISDANGYVLIMVCSNCNKTSNILCLSLFPHVPTWVPMFPFMYLPSLITNFKSKLLTNQQECEILFNA